MSRKMGHRLAIVQHGDFLAAEDLILSGGQETYAGMKASVEALRELMGAADNALVISLEAEARTTVRGSVVHVGVPEVPRRFALPRRIFEGVRSRSILRAVSEFEPTHLLLRTSTAVADTLLDYAAANQVVTSAVFAAYFAGPSTPALKKLVKRLNHPTVVLVANHRAPAASSLVSLGCDETKVVAYDVESQSLGSVVTALPKPVLAPPYRVLFVGSLIVEKGAADVLNSCLQLLDDRVDLHLDMIGAGPLLPKLEATVAASRHAGKVTLHGRLGNGEVLQRVHQAHVCCVMSHHAYSEGMPMTLTEALAMGTPCIVSDHPVFVAALRDGRGIRMVPERNPSALAKALKQVLTDSSAYELLRGSTAEALHALHCPVTFSDVMRRFASTLNHQASAPS